MNTFAQKLQWIGAASLAAILVVFTWKHYLPASAPVGKTVAAKEDKRIDETPHETITPKSGVEVLVPAAKGTLNLPADKQSNPKEHVLTAVTVAPDEHPQSVISILNEDTGKTEVVTQRMDYPLIMPEQTGEVRMSYGMKNGGIKVGRISAHEDLLQIKGFHFGVDGSFDTTSAYFVGVSVAWKW